MTPVHGLQYAAPGVASPATSVFHAPKQGANAAENEDAWAVAAPRLGVLRAAVADGATESAFAGAWARHLVEAFTLPHSDAPWPVDVAALRGKWGDRHRQAGAELPWYAEAKAREGAFAAFLGVEWRADGTWRAAAVGDCCLFHAHAHGWAAWPFTGPDDFHNRPHLLSSHAGPHSDAPFQVTAGTWSPGDTFIVATDAAAAWLLGRVLPDALAWAPDVLGARADAAREEGAMRNDDVAIIRIHWA